jgi:hypothetical protein
MFCIVSAYAPDVRDQSMDTRMTFRTEATRKLCDDVALAISYRLLFHIFFVFPWSATLSSTERMYLRAEPHIQINNCSELGTVDCCEDS